MGFSRPKGILAGYHSQNPAPEAPAIEHFGEQWAPRSYEIGYHSHRVWELYLQIKGKTVWEAEGRRYTVGAYGLLAIPPLMVHRLVLTPDSRHHFYFCAVDVESVLVSKPELLSIWRDDRVVEAPDARSLLTPFQTLAREITLDLPFRVSGIRAALDHLLIAASRLIVDSGRPAALLPHHPAVLHSRELIDMQPEHNWSLGELAARSNISAAHLCERFRLEVGVPPKQYLLQVRLNRTIKLLSESDLSITEIAMELGYSSGQHMAAMIKQRTGQTPSEHRAAPSGDAKAAPARAASGLGPAR